jgi:hypothetical protein
MLNQAQFGIGYEISGNPSIDFGVIEIRGSKVVKNPTHRAGLLLMKKTYSLGVHTPKPH